MTARRPRHARDFPNRTVGLPEVSEKEDREQWLEERQYAMPLSTLKITPKTSDGFSRYVKNIASDDVTLSLRDVQQTPLEIDRVTLRNIAKGKQAIDKTIDLHDLTLENAERYLTERCLQCCQRNQRLLLVITGKGKLGQGVIRRQLPLWLGGVPLKSVVSSYHEARNIHGGSGAFYVRLRRHRSENI